MNICAVCTHAYQMRNLPHITNGLFTVPLGQKLRMKISQGMALGSVVRTLVFLSKCTQSKLTNASQMTLPRNVFPKFLNPCQHGNSNCRGKLPNLLVPCVRFTRVLPICRVANMDGAFTSYQSFLVNGSTLKNKTYVTENTKRSIKCT